MNFGKVSGNGIGVGLSQRMFEPLLQELSGRCTMCPSQSGWRREQMQFFSLGTWAQWAWKAKIFPVDPGGSHLILGKSLIEPLEQYASVRNLGGGGERLWEAQRLVRLVSWFREDCRSGSHSPGLCTEMCCSLKWAPKRHCFCWGLSGMAMRKPVPNNNWPISFILFSFFLTSCLVLTLCFSLHLSVLFIRLFLPSKTWPESSDGSRAYRRGQIRWSAQNQQWWGTSKSPQAPAFPIEYVGFAFSFHPCSFVS